MSKGFHRKLKALGLVGATALLLQACFPVTLSVIVVVQILIVGLAVSGPFKKPKTKTEIPVEVSGQIGGLDGVFDLTLGEYGTISGTADIKGQKSAKMKAKDDEATNAVVEAIVLDQTGVEIDVTKSKAVFKGSQTTGGVEKRYKLQIKWKGEVASGPDAGTRVRGKFKTKGSFE